MSENSKIEWTDATFNPWWGCQKISPACDHCYAERDAHRYQPGKMLWGVDSERRTFGDKHWNEPLRWARTLSAKLGRRPRVFCASMGDWLDLDAPLDDFVRLLDTIRRTPELDWLLLSKRIGNWRKRLEEAATYRLAVILADTSDPRRDALYQWIRAWLDDHAPTNVWLGATVINQAEADRDIPKLLATPARVRFLSIEPMLGPIHLPWALCSCPWKSDAFATRHMLSCPADNRPRSAWRGLDWVIAGGESGPKARPMHPDWARSLREQCAAAGVPFLFKQWGEWAPIGALPVSRVESIAVCAQDGSTMPVGKANARLDDGRRFYAVYRIGKKAAGRLLDGVEHNGFPPDAPRNTEAGS